MPTPIYHRYIATLFKDRRTATTDVLLSTPTRSFQCIRFYIIPSCRQGPNPMTVRARYARKRHGYAPVAGQNGRVTNTAPCSSGFGIVLQLLAVSALIVAVKRLRQCRALVAACSGKCCGEKSGSN